MPREYTLHSAHEPSHRIDYKAELNEQQHAAVVSPPATEARGTDVARMLVAAREHDPSEALFEPHSRFVAEHPAGFLVDEPHDAAREEQDELFAAIASHEVG